jgi:hypothetical protein
LFIRGVAPEVGATPVWAKSGEMKHLLSDCFGRSVRLNDERLRHILGHREMEGLESLIQETLLNPEMVIQSRSDSDVSLFYHLLPETSVGVKWLCVVVKYQLADAFVITAYLTDRPKKGVQQWQEK